MGMRLLYFMGSPICVLMISLECLVRLKRVGPDSPGFLVLAALLVALVVSRVAGGHRVANAAELAVRR